VARNFTPPVYFHGEYRKRFTVPTTTRRAVIELPNLCCLVYCDESDFSLIQEWMNMLFALSRHNLRRFEFDYLDSVFYISLFHKVTISPEHVKLVSTMSFLYSLRCTILRGESHKHAHKPFYQKTRKRISLDRKSRRIYEDNTK
jgi:hypothetical protein